MSADRSGCLPIVIVVAIVFVLFGSMGGNSHSTQGNSTPSSSTSASVSSSSNSSNHSNGSSNSSSLNSSHSTPSYEDPRWPTRYSELLAVPESQRWYNAVSQVGTNCTIVGPVVNVYQDMNSAGMPIFIDIGEAYPSPSCVTLVIWSDAYYDFAEMINDVDDGGAWLSVTGYLSLYNGRPQFNISDGYISYTWWTHVS